MPSVVQNKEVEWPLPVGLRLMEMCVKGQGREKDLTIRQDVVYYAGVIGHTVFYLKDWTCQSLLRFEGS